MAKFTWDNIWTKWSQWEYWPAWLINIPVLFMWLIQGIRNGSLLFFSRVNPDIETGGFFSEEKWPIYQMFPDEFVPKGILINPGEQEDDIFIRLDAIGFKFPILAKPNIGERGMGISILVNSNELKIYHQKAKFDYILQQFVNFPLEMSVLAFRMPSDPYVHVTSICLKEKLTITGDGKSTIQHLVMRDYRSRNQWTRLEDQFNGNRILELNEKLVLEPIGNHSRGTTFFDGNHLNTEKVRLAVEKLIHSIRGEIFYGRFDIIYQSMEDFIGLKNFKVIEFNGVGSEPAHIYQPGFPIIQAYRTLWQHAKILGDISLAQKERGVRAMPWSEFWHALRVYRKNLASVKYDK